MMLAYSKPKIVMLDDERVLLDVIEYYFTEKFQNAVLLKTFSKSSDFLSYVEENCYLPESASTIINAFYNDAINRKSIIKTLNDLADLSAIIVLDQELREEEITGIDLSIRLREYLPASYISMLTSNVPNSKAIELHNNHNIDLFIDKKDPNAIHDLYVFLSKHIASQKSEFLTDAIDIFYKADNLEDEIYQNSKNKLIEENNPMCYLTINIKGDIALMEENKLISFWQFDTDKKQFIEYE